MTKKAICDIVFCEGDATKNKTVFCHIHKTHIRQAGAFAPVFCFT